MTSYGIMDRSGAGSQLHILKGIQPTHNSHPPRLQHDLDRFPRFAPRARPVSSSPALHVVHALSPVLSTISYHSSKSPSQPTLRSRSRQPGIWPTRLTIRRACRSEHSRGARQLCRRPREEHRRRERLSRRRSAFVRHFREYILRHSCDWCRLTRCTQLGITNAVAHSVPKPYVLFGLAGAIPYLGASGATIYLARQAGVAAQGAYMHSKAVSIVGSNTAHRTRREYGPRSRNNHS